MKLAGLLGPRIRRAAAVVEMAIVAPVLMTMLFGIIEYGWVFMYKQSLTNAAREGCRVATMQGSTDSQITSAITNYMSGMGLKSTDYTVSLTHYDPSNPNKTNETVTVSVPYSKVSLLGGFFGSTNWSMGSTCTMRKEGLN